MSSNAVIDGCFADFRLVKTRSICQLVIEIPIERAEEAVQKFGLPLPGQEIHVAVARLTAASEVPAPAVPPSVAPMPFGNSAGASGREHKSAAARERYQ